MNNIQLSMFVKKISNYDYEKEDFQTLIDMIIKLHVFHFLEKNRDYLLQNKILPCN